MMPGRMSENHSTAPAGVCLHTSWLGHRVRNPIVSACIRTRSASAVRTELNQQTQSVEIPLLVCPSAVVCP
jgi:hypothetical protein